MKRIWEKRKWPWLLPFILAMLAAAAIPLFLRGIKTTPAREDAQVTDESRAGKDGMTDNGTASPSAIHAFPCTLKIPSLGLEFQVREGDREQWRLHLLLREGPVHLPWTSPPGPVGNCVISGHRTTYTRPFHRLDELKEGDEILLSGEGGFHVYRVYRVYQVGYWVDVTGFTLKPTLTLITCTPKGSSSHRLVVRASYQGFMAAGSEPP